MKDHHLRAWLKVVELRSIRAAARSLHLSQAAVTKAIKELEAELDAPLLTRSTKGIAITECGELLTVRARLAENQLNLARQDIRQLQGGVRARVSVGVTPMVLLSVLPDVVTDFRKTMPAARIKVIEGLLPAVLTALRSGALDFAIAGRAEVSEDLYSFEPLQPLEFMIACRTGHPLACATRWSDVVDCEWAFNFSTGTQANSFLNGLRAKGLPVPERVIECDTFGILWTLMTRCDALQIVPTAMLAVKPYSEQVRRVPINVPIPRAEIGIMTLRDTPLSLAAETMASIFRRHISSKESMLVA